MPSLRRPVDFEPGWWLDREVTVVTTTCNRCGASVQAYAGTALRCPNCGHEGTAPIVLQSQPQVIVAAANQWSSTTCGSSGLTTRLRRLYIAAHGEGARGPADRRSTKGSGPHAERPRPPGPRRCGHDLPLRARSSQAKRRRADQDREGLLGLARVACDRGRQRTRTGHRNVISPPHATAAPPGHGDRRHLLRLPPARVVASRHFFASDA